MNTLVYYLSEHPQIVGFRWNHSQSWGSTWSFLFAAISLYLIVSAVLHIILAIFLRRGRSVPLGPIPAVHSLAMSILSATIFAGILLSTAAEIRTTRWSWRRSRTTSALHWLLCFPIGTRSSGRVFFWSYVFYLTRFLQMVRTVFTILKRRKLAFFQLFCNSISVCAAFLWLEFSQSYQILAILFATLVYSVVYGYRFWTGLGLPGSWSLPPSFVANCQMVLVGCNLVSHVGVLIVHLFQGGCNGIGAWTFNSVLNGAILLLFLKFYVKMHLGKKKNIATVVKPAEIEPGKLVKE